ncbi:MAG: hypothetical protein Q7V63_09825 [Gammaproteobacteria bacterium]|nr:hypothetical protein [Gammaproteobacteria bacterium]
MDTSSGNQLTSDALLEDGQIQFYDNYVPTLTVGDYVINFSQDMNSTSVSGKAITDNYTTSQTFTVQGPRYSLSPSDILSFGPSANTSGLYDQYLPQAVLIRPDLPWERNIFNDVDKSNQTPWLALLLFVEGELINDQPTLLPPDVPNWEEQKNRSLTATISASQFYDHGSDSDILWPDIKPEWYESDEDLKNTQSNIIDISLEAFKRFVPGQADLRYLAHARQIDPSQKDSSYLKTITNDGWYSVLMGKRLPNLPVSDANDPSLPLLPGRLNIVHLVSLEGFQDYLSDKTDKKTLPTDKKCIRMISLANWSFTCLEEPGDSFADLVKGLLKDEQGQQKSTAYNLATLDSPNDPNTVAQNYTAETLAKGYVPMQYQTQQGEQTFAWYRGPFSPLPIQNFIGDPFATDPTLCVFDTASAATIYNPDYGLFDLSYSVAWETGRNMALSDSCFGPKLIAWQQAGNSLLDLLLHRQFQLTTFNGAAPDSKTLIASLKPRSLTQEFVKQLTQKFASTLAPKLYGKISEHAKNTPRRKAYAKLTAPIPSKKTLDRLLQDPEVNSYVVGEGDEGAQYLTEWLANLYLLEGVPFENLLPNPGLLPEESVKFFYVDSNWLDCLIEGALSIGIQSSRDQYYQNLTKQQLYSSTYQAANQARAKLVRKYTSRKPALTSEPVNKTAMAGMLLRSTVVESWPGLEIKAYAKTLSGSNEPDTSTAIALLRMDRLSSDVMLCLWSQVPAVITITEPQEGIQFGFEDSFKEGGSIYCLHLRSLDTSNYGETLDDQYEIDAVADNLIDADRQIILEGESGLIKALEDTLPTHPTTIYVRDFVTEMIKVPEQGIFAYAASTENAGKSE